MATTLQRHHETTTKGHFGHSEEAGLCGRTIKTRRQGVRKSYLSTEARARIAAWQKGVIRKKHFPMSATPSLEPAYDYRSKADGETVAISTTLRGKSLVSSLHLSHIRCCKHVKTYLPPFLTT